MQPHVNQKNKVEFLIEDVPSNFPIPFVSNQPLAIPPWNKNVDLYIEFMFIFVNKFFH